MFLTPATWQLIADSIITILIVIFSLIIYRRTHAMYGLTQYHGLRYFSNGFLFLGIAFGFRLTVLFMQATHIPWAVQLLGIGFLYSASVAGFHASYSLVWKQLEQKLPAAFWISMIHTASAIIAAFEFYYINIGAERGPYILFVIHINTLLLSLVSSHCKEARESGIARSPHFFSIVLVFVVFLAFFLGTLLETLIPFMGLATIGFSLVLFAVVLYEVMRFSRGFA